MRSWMGNCSRAQPHLGDSLVFVYVCVFFPADIDECATGRHTCGPEQTCYNTKGSYTCQCPVGYQRSGDRCIGESHCLCCAVLSFSGWLKRRAHFDLSHCPYLCVCVPLQTEMSAPWPTTACTDVWTHRVPTTASAAQVTSWPATTTAVLVSHRKGPRVLTCAGLHKCASVVSLHW